MGKSSPEQIEKLVREHFKAKAECDRDTLGQQFAADVVVWTLAVPHESRLRRTPDRRR